MLGRGLLERNQDEDHAFAFGEAGHGFADDSAVGARVIGGFHGVTGDAGGGDEIAGFNGAIGGISHGENAAGESDGMLAVGFGAFLAHEHAGFDAARAADDAGDGAIISASAGDELTGI